MIIRRVVGNSMLPYLKPGNIVLVKKVKKYKIGDIVIANVNNRQVIKRVKNINNNLYELIGDNKNESTDSRSFGMVQGTDIKGVVFKSYNFFK